MNGPFVEHVRTGLWIERALGGFFVNKLKKCAVCGEKIRTNEPLIPTTSRNIALSTSLWTLQLPRTIERHLHSFITSPDDIIIGLPPLVDRLLVHRGCVDPTVPKETLIKGAERSIRYNIQDPIEQNLLLLLLNKGYEGKHGWMDRLDCAAVAWASRPALAARISSHVFTFQKNKKEYTLDEKELTSQHALHEQLLET